MAPDSSFTAVAQENSKATTFWTPEIAKFIATEIAQGEYESETELVLDAVRQLREQKLQVLRREIQIGVDDIEQNRIIHIPDDAAHELHAQTIWREVLERAAELNSRPQ
jgi:putative addiction module CopG family antidote